jgi:hypothetical protein
VVRSDLLKLLSTWRRKAGLRNAFRETFVLKPSTTWVAQLEEGLKGACGHLGTECHLEKEAVQDAVTWRIYRLTATHNVWSGQRRQKRHTDETSVETSLALDVWCCCSLLTQASATDQGPGKAKMAVVLEAKQPTSATELASWFSLWKAQLVPALEKN